VIVAFNVFVVKPARPLPRVGLCSCSTTNALTGSIVLAAAEVKPDRNDADSQEKPL